MLHASVRLLDPAGHEHDLVHGDVVGRLWTAALQLDDGRVSEAHAMVSLREGLLQLIPLRGALAVGGTPQNHVSLRPGVEIELARGVTLRVLAVNLPDSVLGIEGPSLVRQMMPGVCSVVLDPTPRVVRGWRDDSALRVWTTGEGWMACYPGEPPQPVVPGATWSLGAAVVTFVDIPLHAASPQTTRRGGAIDAPLHIIAQFETVHLHREQQAPVVLAGMQARLVSELVALGGPVAWATLAGELWPDEGPAVQRSRLDTLISRVRRRLRTVGIRASLVHTDGAGSIELLRYPHDRVEDCT
ncbi:MAG: FHA domain-containing protein [Myxococcota bacterium]